VRSLSTNDTWSSHPVAADEMAGLHIGNLLESYSYAFTITSLNTIGEGRSQEVSFG